MTTRPTHWSARLPFYFGWLIIGIAFVTMAIAVTARTTFSLLLPPLIVLAISCCVVSAAAIWIAAPRGVRLVPGRLGAE